MAENPQVPEAKLIKRQEHTDVWQDLNDSSSKELKNSNKIKIFVTRT